jgi:uncharacterized protein
VPELSPLGWLVLAVAAGFAGFSKTAIGGAGVVAAALAALILPARASTGTILPLLICGDVIGVTIYRRGANWRLILRLMPWVLAGIGLGVVFLDVVRGNRAVRLWIGVMILAVLGAHLLVGGRLRERLTTDGEQASTAQRLAAGLAGVGVGFTTMVANSAGAIMTVYLLLSGVTMLEFLGTGAWFFCIVNLLKLPFSVRLGLVDGGSLRLDLALLPALAAGCALGVVLVRRIRRTQFERAALGMAAVSALVLLS